MVYLQLTQGERYVIARMRASSKSLRENGRCLCRSVSTISRGVERNRCPHDGWYRWEKAHSRAMARRSRSQYSPHEWAEVVAHLRRKWSPEQISGRRKLERRRLISHETIYRYVRRERRRGGELWRQMRVMSKIARKKRGSPVTRGRLLGKRHISQRPRAVEHRKQIGHYEGDTVMGPDGRHCVLTLDERKTGYLVMRKLSARNKEQASAALVSAIAELDGKIRTITLDNGTELHDYASVEERTGVKFYFATPYHSWERGTNENTNGLIRQYLPKGHRPRERLGFRTPAEALRRVGGVALQS